MPVCDTRGARRHRRRSTTCSALAALVVVAALLATGCGSGGGASKAQFEEGLARLQAQLDEASVASASVKPEASAEEHAESIGRAHAQLVKAADTADALDPPSDVRAIHEQLAKALRDYADVFRRIAEAPADDPNATTALYGEAGEVYARLQEANEALEEAGYAVERPKERS